MEQALISIIVPVYNVENYLNECINSLVSQTYSNIEIICVNDGSTDRSGAILNECAKEDKRIRIINQSNRGLSAARNAGIHVALGKYMMFVDSDDWIDKETCENALFTAEKYKADVVFWCYTREYGNHSNEKHLFWRDGYVFEENDVRKLLHRRFCGLLGEELAHPEYANSIETAWGKLYRTDLIGDIAFVDTKIIGTEDALFNLYVFGNVKRAVYLDRCYNHYRKSNNQSLTHTYKRNLFAQWQSLFEYIRNYIFENRLPCDYETALKNRIALSIIGLGLNICGSDMALAQKRKTLNSILITDQYKAAYKQLCFKYFPIHWKVFFMCAKKGFSGFVLLLLLVMKRLK